MAVVRCASSLLTVMLWVRAAMCVCSQDLLLVAVVQVAVCRSTLALHLLVAVAVYRWLQEAAALDTTVQAQAWMQAAVQVAAAAVWRSRQAAVPWRVAM